MILDPSAARVAADLAEGDFRAGLDAGHWRIIAFDFPILDFAIVAGKDTQGGLIEYGFRAELSEFPAQAPMVQIWDHAANALLVKEKRPNGNQRMNITFQSWGDETIYRPWDRKTGPHNDNGGKYPHLAWRPERHLSFIFRDLHGILNSNARADRIRAVA